MRKTVVIVLISFLFSVLACSIDRYPDDPEAVYDRYMRAMSKGDYKRALKYISEKDRKIFIENNKSLHETPYLAEFDALMFSLTKWEVKDAELSDDSASLLIQHHAPNYGALLGEFIGRGLSGQLEQKEKNTDFRKMAYEEVTERLKANDYDLMDNEEKITFEKEKGKWKVFLNLAVEEEISRLTSHALELFREQQYEESKRVLEKIRTLDPDNTIVEMYIPKINERLKAVE